MNEPETPLPELGMDALNVVRAWERTVELFLADAARARARRCGRPTATAEDVTATLPGLLRKLATNADARHWWGRPIRERFEPIPESPSGPACSTPPG